MSASAPGEFHHAYLGLGSNIDPAENLLKAAAALGCSLQVQAFSSVWETPPVGGKGANFLNAVLSVYTPLALEALREQVLRPLEARMGRVRTADPNAPRPIDLDVLLYDGRVIEPEVWEQAYWAAPLAELLPELAHPESGETLAQVARRLGASTALCRRAGISLG